MWTSATDRLRSLAFDENVRIASYWAMIACISLPLVRRLRLTPEKWVLGYVEYFLFMMAILEIG